MVVWVGLKSLMRLSEEAEILKGQCRLYMGCLVGA